MMPDSNPLPQARELPPEAARYFLRHNCVHFIPLTFVFAATLGIEGLACYSGVISRLAVERTAEVFSLMFLIDASLCGWHARVFARRYRYELDQENLSILEGVFAPVQSTVLYRNIQNVTVRSTILSRPFGLANIVIQASLTAYERALSPVVGHMPRTVRMTRIMGLRVKDAEELRDELLQRANQARHIPQ